jgi:hypothetical protein
MHWRVCLLTILLSGCQGASLSERPTEDAQPHIMQLWKLYQQCLATDDPTEFVSIIDRFERVMHAGTEPPSWMKAWGLHVKAQPLRTSVDPQALGAACTVRVATMMTAMNHPEETRALYQRVLARYGHREWTYYVDQAKERLADLEHSSSAIVSLRADHVPSR